LTTQDEKPNKKVTPPEHRDDMSLKNPGFSFSKTASTQTFRDESRLDRTLIEKQEIELADAHRELQNLRNKNRELEHFQSVLTVVSQDAIIATDRNLSITEWNQKAELLFGWKADEVMSQTVSPEVSSHIVEALKKDEVFDGLASQGYWIGTLPAVSRGGRSFSSRVSIGVLWDQAGAFDGLIAVYHKISENPLNVSKLIDSDLEKRVKQRT
jgi:PAS domain S-box-containing protein